MSPFPLHPPCNSMTLSPFLDSSARYYARSIRVARGDWVSGLPSCFSVQPIVTVLGFLLTCRIVTVLGFS